jgi:uncharacterized iron-regulated membrane protein
VRRAIFWAHLALGVVAGSVVFVLCVTGALLAFEPQVLAWAERDVRSVAAPPGGARLPLEDLIARVRAAGHDVSPTAVTVRADPAAAVALALGRDGVLYVDPYTGAVRGESSPAARGVFRVVTDVHRFLGARGESRPAGRAVTGAANLAFLGLVVTGPFLWWPKQWSGRALRPIAFVQRGLAGRARDFNWHNVAGLWLAVPLFFIVVTGAAISYAWVGALAYRMVGEQPPAARGPAAPARRSEGTRALPSPAGLNRLWPAAEAHVPGWQAITARFPTSPKDPLVFTIERGHRGRPDLRAQLTLDLATGAVREFSTFESASRGRRLRTWMRWVHTGEAGGVAGQTLGAAACLGGALLAWTGIALSWRRLAAWRRQRTSEGTERATTWEAVR